MRKLRQKEIELDGQRGWSDVWWNDLAGELSLLTDRGMIVTRMDVEPGRYRVYYVPKGTIYTYEERNNIETSDAVHDAFVRHIKSDNGGVPDKPRRRTITASKQLNLI